MPYLYRTGKYDGQIINEAKLDSGEIVVYDACSGKGPNAYDHWINDDKKPIYEYIGDGIFYSHNGVIQNSKKKESFFVKVKY